MPQRIYIAGKISDGGKEMTYEHYARIVAKFNRAKEYLLAQGYEVISPIDLINDPKINWYRAMSICIEELLQCDAVFFLNDWKDSRGARIEYAVANEQNLILNFESSA